MTLADATNVLADILELASWGVRGDAKIVSHATLYIYGDKHSSVASSVACNHTAWCNHWSKCREGANIISPQ